MATPDALLTTYRVNYFVMSPKGTIVHTSAKARVEQEGNVGPASDAHDDMVFLDAGLSRGHMNSLDRVHALRPAAIVAMDSKRVGVFAMEIAVCSGR